MPFKIIRNDITKVKADARVNTANPNVLVGSGTDTAIYNAAGKDELLAERKKIGIMFPGQAAYTNAFNLNAKYIIHTVGPTWINGFHSERECYEKSLNIAAELKCKSIAFPLIATGVYGFPKDEALQIALSEINKFLLLHDVM
ncbi:macro domain-containing protein [Eubacteriales bacterium KG127]